MTSFVNPYTFVPHVPVPERRPPAGHDRLRPGSLSGVLEVTVTARTPLLIGGSTDKRDREKIILPRRVSGSRQVMIPGSGFLGVVRSLHETLTGSCLRVLNTDWAPAHRHPAHIRETEGLVFAVVTDFQPAEEKGKLPVVKVKVADEAWDMVPLEKLSAMPRTGDQFAAEGDDLRKLGPMGKLPGDEDRRVLLVTDTKVRQQKKPLRFAVGRIAAGAPERVVPANVVKKYQDVVAGADDLRPGVLGQPKEPKYDPENPDPGPVCWPPQSDFKVAERLRARTYLHVGQPVYVELDERGEVSEIRLSQLWRYQGEGLVRERAGGAEPCRYPDQLCWSCRIFGSADTEGRDDDDLAVQRGYRGHVRFDDLLLINDKDERQPADIKNPVVWHLAPLMSPKPSAGQFYLDNSNTPLRDRLADGKEKERPAATWGSVADNETIRPIRGRKYYWRSQTMPESPKEGGRHRAQFRPGQHAKDAAKRAEVIPAGSVFTGRIRFDNLSVTDYGSLLAALEPTRLAKPDDGSWAASVTSVGGGKPFGFGAVKVTVEPVLIQSASARYLGEVGDGPVSPDEAVKAFVGQVPGQAREQWERLRHVLRPGYVNGGEIKYPPGSDDLDSKKYSQSFKFFGETNGVRLTERPSTEMIYLPDPEEPKKDQAIEFVWGDASQRGTRDA